MAKTDNKRAVSFRIPAHWLQHLADAPESFERSVTDAINAWPEHQPVERQLHLRQLMVWLRPVVLNRLDRIAKRAGLTRSQTLWSMLERFYARSED